MLDPPFEVRGGINDGGEVPRTSMEGRRQGTMSLVRVYLKGVGWMYIVVDVRGGMH